MKLNTLEKLYDCLASGQPEVTVDPDIAEKALRLSVACSSFQ